MCALGFEFNAINEVIGDFEANGIVGLAPSSGIDTRSIV
jgi:hypothetical protein